LDSSTILNYQAINTNEMRSICQVHNLGMIGYEQAWRLQEALASQISRGDPAPTQPGLGRPPTLLLLEHPHTYTFGRRGQVENLLWDPAELERRGVSVYWVDRGGDVTYHGPGQLVGYPLLPLGPARVQADTAPSREFTGLETGRVPQVDYIGYLRKLERMLIAALQELGVACGQLPGLTGVWALEEGTAPAKLAAIGVKVDARGITRHGFALNVNPDMTYWEGIIGCGLRDHPSTSLADLLETPPSMEQVVRAVIRSFADTFDYEIILQPFDWPGTEI
jgi:lipoyl(octanoyl) transferase